MQNLDKANLEFTFREYYYTANLNSGEFEYTRLIVNQSDLGAEIMKCKKLYGWDNKMMLFLEKNYLHFNSASLVDAAKGYKKHLDEGGKMMITLAGAMSTAELGISLAEMIRQDKVAIISCTGANLEEDLMNLVAHSHYKRPRPR